jgi:molybdopterin-containing oxidoreductase family membrane subunit
MLLGSFAYLAASALAKRFSFSGTVAASSVVLLAFWLKRFLIVIPSLTHPRLELYPSGVYVPTWVEYSLVLGTVAIAMFLISLFIKVFPVMEVKGARELTSENVDKKGA